MPISTTVTRVGIIAPCLEGGGGENATLNLIDSVNAYAPSSGIYWEGMAVLDDPLNASAAMKTATEAVIPVIWGVDAMYSLAVNCDILISWAVYPFNDMAVRMASFPKLVFWALRGESWNSTASSWLAPASKIVACSSPAASVIPSGFSSIATTIVNAIDPSRLTIGTTKAAKQGAWGVPSGNGVVGFLGRLESEREPLAMARLANALPSGWTAVVVGEGSLSGSIASTATDGNLILTGADNDAGSCLNAFDWLVNPTLAESFGYTTAQAWYLGIPVIGTTAHGLASLHTSYLRSITPNATGPVIAAALASDMADPTGTSSRVSSAKSWATSNLSKSAFGNAWASLLTSLSSTSGGGGGPG